MISEPESERAGDAAPGATVRIVAPARLHLGFVDVSGDAGRRFGSLGLTLEHWSTTLLMSRDDRTPDGAAAALPEPEHHAGRVAANAPHVAVRLEQYLQRLETELGRALPVRVWCTQPTPAHAGFGTGTQLALALAAALRRVAGLHEDVRALAARLDRGRRSGIGIGAFEHGGFLVDGGLGPDAAPPPLIARLPVPDDWRVVLLFDGHVQGLHGAPEVEAFARLPAFEVGQAHRLAHRVLMGVLPALVEHDLAAFGRAIGEIQRVVGDHFAPAQGGRFSSPRVAHVLDWLLGQGHDAVGQSSWGPTGFAIVDGQAQALALERQIASLRDPDGVPWCDTAVTTARNRGADAC